MNKVVKYSIISVVLLVIVFVVVYVCKFRVGNSNYKDITINKVSVGSSIVIDGYYKDSSIAYRDYKYTLVGRELYVEVKNVLVSSKYNSGSFSIIIPLNESEVDNIHLTDGKTTKVIYSKEG